MTRQIQIRVYSTDQSTDFSIEQLDQIETLLEATSRSPYDKGTPQWHFVVEDVPNNVLLQRIRTVLDAGYKVKHPAHIPESEWTPFAN